MNVTLMPPPTRSALWRQAYNETRHLPSWERSGPRLNARFEELLRLHGHVVRPGR